MPILSLGFQNVKFFLRVFSFARYFHCAQLISFFIISPEIYISLKQFASRWPFDSSILESSIPAGPNGLSRKPNNLDHPFYNTIKILLDDYLKLLDGSKTTLAKNMQTDWIQKNHWTCYKLE
ncbi:hypothetical protein B9Z55_028533 [Caenorhabditis nigoni]|uniref:Uncharacterized protein n=1 Tax=Caenorhabditis nigoni TaxID=1611254 RepID=A0A2G5SBL9_9PELO|nr:hypothetical protein B9Z55_028533 [Caenorhabditis nigoni]